MRLALDFVQTCVTTLICLQDIVHYGDPQKTVYLLHEQVLSLRVAERPAGRQVAGIAVCKACRQELTKVCNYSGSSDFGWGHSG